MIKDPAGPGATPLVILCKDLNHPEEFQARYKYKYEVLGGMHTFMANHSLFRNFLNAS